MVPSKHIKGLSDLGSFLMDLNSIFWISRDLVDEFMVGLGGLSNWGNVSRGVACPLVEAWKWT